MPLTRLRLQLDRDSGGASVGLRTAESTLELFSDALQRLAGRRSRAYAENLDLEGRDSHYGVSDGMHRSGKLEE